MENEKTKKATQWYVMRAYKNERRAEECLSGNTYGLSFFIPKQRKLRTVNGRKVNIPSFRVKPGDLVAVAPKAKDLLPIKSALISNERTEVPGWLEVDIEKLQGSVLSLPTREQIDLDIREQLIVELYSK